MAPSTSRSSSRGTTPTPSTSWRPTDLGQGEFLYIGLGFEDGRDIDVEVEANLHADAERFPWLGLDDYRIDERRYSNNTDPVIGLRADLAARSPIVSVVSDSSDAATGT